ncbi:hypothetical protein ACJX0J_034259, partial [Zea mays]
TVTNIFTASGKNFYSGQEALQWCVIMHLLMPDCVLCNHLLITHKGSFKSARAMEAQHLSINKQIRRSAWHGKGWTASKLKEVASCCIILFVLLEKILIYVL